eukprot:768792-Hanusia_phi.AAC.17
MAIVKRLLDAKASVNYANEFDQTALGSPEHRIFDLVRGSIDQGRKSKDLAHCGFVAKRSCEERVDNPFFFSSFPKTGLSDIRIGAGNKELEALDEFGDSPLHIVHTYMSSLLCCLREDQVCGAKEPSIAAAHLLLEASIDVERLNVSRSEGRKSN